MSINIVKDAMESQKLDYYRVVSKMKGIAKP